MRSDVDPLLCFTEKLFGLPRTRSGWWAVGLESFFFALAAAMIGRGGQAGWGVRAAANVLAGAAGLTAIGAGAASAVAIFRHGERSLALFLILLLGTLVLIFSTALLA
jgi:hypothetical protein